MGQIGNHHSLPLGILKAPATENRPAGALLYRAELPRRSGNHLQHSDRAAGGWKGDDTGISKCMKQEITEQRITGERVAAAINCDGQTVEAYMNGWRELRTGRRSPSRACSFLGY